MAGIEDAGEEDFAFLRPSEDNNTTTTTNSTSYSFSNSSGFQLLHENPPPPPASSSSPPNFVDIVEVKREAEIDYGTTTEELSSSSQVVPKGIREYYEGGVLIRRTGSSRVSLGERVAARAGFSTPRLNTTSLLPNSSSSTAAAGGGGNGSLASPLRVQSPYLTIPAGLSPTTLLDSPVVFLNSQAQPSPTTGTFPLASFIQRSIGSYATGLNGNTEQSYEAKNAQQFAFKPHLKTNCGFGSQNEGNQISIIDQQPPWPGTSVQSMPPSSIQNSTVAEAPFQPKVEVEDHQVSNPQEMTLAVSSIENRMMIAASNSFSGREQATYSDGQFEADRKPQSLTNSLSVELPSDDGYNWRKYGQKPVKGGEYPRSYYKCTHSDCQVRKKIERSHDGRITEIIYKGTHNHPKPPPNRRSLVGSMASLDGSPFDSSQDNGLLENADGQQGWKMTQLEAAVACKEWDAPETASLSSMVSNFSDPSAALQTQNLNHPETADAPEVSSAPSNFSNGEDEDEDANGSMLVAEEADGDDVEAKRRKKDSCILDANIGASRAIREPRVVVQTTSEVDILDDGYRWRKYGQKVVKGNPNPRSYYKCTHPGCTVRKHVERASHDLKSVITTYEGKHNHDVPAARSNSHINSAPAAHVAGPPSHIHKPEPLPPQDDMMAYGSHLNHLANFAFASRQQMAPINTNLPGFSHGQQQQLMNLALAGLAGSQGGLGNQPFLSQQRGLGEPLPGPPGGLLNQESTMPEPVLPNGDSSIYQLMSRHPLGPQM